MRLYTHKSSFYKKGNLLKKEEKLNKLDTKNVSGITLIALVITIVVLLILARNNYPSSITRRNYRASK
ncbi:MAG: hypothetical protein HFJ28_03670 [Clostridia bacterium]|nr:hypothetical protein [Clostridia bacterium]